MLMHKASSQAVFVNTSRHRPVVVSKFGATFARASDPRTMSAKESRVIVVKLIVGRKCWILIKGCGCARVM